jgi:GTP-binding protein Era
VILEASTPTRIHTGYAVIAGAANSGKSTLLNSLAGRTISPVTPQPGTTRVPLSGLCHGKTGQVCLIDTPPLPTALNLRLLDWMDAACLMVDARDLEGGLDSSEVRSLLDVFSKRPVVLALSHVDRFDRNLWQALLRQACLIHDFSAAVAVCPPRGTGNQELLEAVIRQLPLRRKLFPDSCTTLHSERFLVSEIIRTELFHVLPEEIASTTAVQIEEYSLRDAKTYVRANLLVSRHSFKGIVIGRRGQTLQRIVECAARGAESLLGKSVQPDLWVKVRESWPENPHDLLEFGYVI